MGESRPRTTVVLHAPGRAFAPGAQSALVRLGYNLVSPATAARWREAEMMRPLLRIVDERQLAELPVDERPPLPIVLLCGARGPMTADARAVGCVRRRAGLGELYPLLQRALEPHPREVPRISEVLPARCTRDGRQWSGLIRSLSERGCLLESDHVLEKDLRVELTFPLESGRMIRVPAQPAYVDGARAGLVFRGGSELTRSAVADYVARRLES